VQATAPVVVAHAGSDHREFLSAHVNAHPELLRVFNQGNQATGEQSKALAGSVVAYAVQLIDPEAPSFDHVMPPNCLQARLPGDPAGAAHDRRRAPAGLCR
jgi:nitric oxide dioxygenase